MLNKTNNILKKQSCHDNEVDPVEQALEQMIAPSTEVKSWQRFSQAKAMFVAFQMIGCADVKTPIHQSAQSCVLTQVRPEQSLTSQVEALTDECVFCFCLQIILKLVTWCLTDALLKANND